MSEKKSSVGFFKMLGRCSSSRNSSVGHSRNAHVSILDVAQHTIFTSHQQVARPQPVVEQGDPSSRAGSSWPNIHIIEHKPKTPPHVFLSDEDTLSITAILTLVRVPCMIVLMVMVRMS
jgi:hypothetical protein